MKQFNILLLSTILLGGCKRPYHAIKSSYKPETVCQAPATDVDPHIHKKKNIKDMNLPELRAARIYFESVNEFEFIEKTLERILKLSHDYQEQAECVYELGNIMLSRGLCEKAQELYQQVIDQYPGAPFHRQARYRCILSHFWHCSHPERDQQCTEKTVKLALEYLQEFPTGVDAQHVQEVLVQSYLCLLQAELDRINFYLSKYIINADLYALHAAHKRTIFMGAQLIPSLEKFGYGFSTISDDTVRLESRPVYVPDYVPDGENALTVEQKSAEMAELSHEIERTLAQTQRFLNEHTNRLISEYNARNKF